MRSSKSGKRESAMRSSKSSKRESAMRSSKSSNTESSAGERDGANETISRRVEEGHEWSGSASSRGYFQYRSVFIDDTKITAAGGSAHVECAPAFTENLQCE